MGIIFNGLCLLKEAVQPWMLSMNPCLPRGNSKHTWLLADASKIKEVSYVEGLDNVPVPDRPAPKLIPARLSPVYSRKSMSEYIHKY